MWDVRCEMWDVRFEMRDVRCEMRDVRCKMWDARCEMLLSEMWSKPVAQPQVTNSFHFLHCLPASTGTCPLNQPGSSQCHWINRSDIFLNYKILSLCNKHSEITINITTLKFWCYGWLKITKMGQIKILLRRTYQEACQDILPVFFMVLVNLIWSAIR